MIDVTEDQLKAIMPKSKPDVWRVPLNQAMERFEINTASRAAAFLAQIAHESDELHALEERLSYSAARLMQVWPKRFPTIEKAQEYERNPKRLGNYVYANRLGNGDAASGDGWRFRGRGLIQVTGRGNYRRVGQGISLELELSPDLLQQPDAAALSAGFFWQSQGLNELADDRNDDNDDEDFIAISVRINGGRAGLRQRQTYWDRAKSVLL
jgi:putative chitinase